MNLISRDSEVFEIVTLMISGLDRSITCFNMLKGC